MMRNHTIIKVFAIAAFWGFFLLNAASLRCESPPGGPGNFPAQAKSGEAGVAKNRDQGWLEDQNDREAKSERFRVLEWLIKQKLMSQYQQMEIRDLEELPD